MDIDLDKAFEVVGGKNRYQIYLFFCVCLCWFSTDYIAISLALVLFYPKLFLDGNETDNQKEWCEIYNSNRDRTTYEITYKNILTDMNLYCNEMGIILISIFFTLGLIVGAFLASKYADIIGRKMVALMALASFGVFTTLFTFLNNIWIMMFCLFFMGCGASGGTMSTFILIYECLAKESRNLFGTMINSSYSIAGTCYFIVFMFTYSWKWISVLSLCASGLSFVWLAFRFAESPRFLQQANKNKECLIALMRIAHRNGRVQQYVSYLKEEVFTQKHLKEIDLNILYNTDYRYGEVKKMINNLNYTYFDEKKNTSSFQENSEEKSGEKTPEQMVKQNSTLDSKDLEGLQTTENFIEEGAIEYIENPNDPGLKALFKYQSVRNPFIYCSILWIITAYSYFGQSYIQKDTTEDKVFINGFMLFAAEFLAYLSAGAIMEIKYMGRTRTIGFGGLAVTLFGALFVLFNAINIGSEVPVKIVFFAFRYCITVLFTSLYTYCTEVYPTSVRSQGMGLNLTFARLCTILIATTADKPHPGFWIYVVFAIFGFITFILHFKLKETIGKPLEDEIPEIKEHREQQLKLKSTGISNKSIGSDDAEKINSI